MKNIYFIQAAISKDNMSVYLPYASGCLVAYAMQDDEITRNYSFCDFFFMREAIEDVIHKLNNPYLVSFSCVVGNIEYSRRLAQKIKDLYPQCYLLFGGHGITEDGEFFLQNSPFADFVVSGEGEHAFFSLLKQLLHDKEFESVDNLTYRKNGKIFKNAVIYDYDIKDYPSPYLTGIFDDFFLRYPNVEFHSVIETNRGCPYNCAFCEWCYTKKLRFFPLERVKKEIEWMAEHKIVYCYCADANFGIVPRDLEIAEFVVAVRNKKAYPSLFRPTYAKNSNETVFQIGKLLNQNGADKGVTIAYQSLNEDTLGKIGRTDLDMEYFSKLQQRYAAEGIPSYTEVILGLPGETYESFCSGLCRLLEAGQHNSISVYQCQIYTNALMNDSAYQKEHGIKTARVPINSAHYIFDPNGIQEYFDVVIATATMSHDEWVKANLFSLIVQIFHNMGFLRCFALYARFEKGMSYCDFYHRLMDFVFENNETFLYKLFRKMKDSFYDTETGVWIYRDKKFGDVGWYYEEGGFLELLYNWERFWHEIEPFLSDLPVPENVFSELLLYQKFIIRRPGIFSDTQEFAFDFQSYFNRIYSARFSPLEDLSCRLDMNTGIRTTSWEDYAKKIILGGKRRGETLLINEKNCIKTSPI
ncbi:MAG: B12-binding domain-containing radical SAM protein [Acutalibacteraceae bacterium]|jgi:putative methyltransferase